MRKSRFTETQIVAIDYPPSRQTNVTFKKALRARTTPEAEQTEPVAEPQATYGRRSRKKGRLV